MFELNDYDAYLEREKKSAYLGQGTDKVKNCCIGPGKCKDSSCELVKEHLKNQKNLGGVRINAN